MTAVTPFLGLSGATSVAAPSYAGTPGPGPVPSPWKVNGATIFYDEGGALLPRGVAGGTKGKGSINAQGVFENGQRISQGSGPPSGPAGGDLEGSFYPNPVIKPDVNLDGAATTTTPATPDDLNIANVKYVNDAIAAIPEVTVPATAVAFGAADGSVTGDAAFLVWDELNKRLGIGGTPAGARLEVDSPTGNTDLLIRLRLNGLDKFYVDTFGNASAAGGFFALGSQFAQQATPVPVGGLQDCGYLWSTTPHLGIIFGAGAPDKVMARGSWYQRVDATAAIPPLYYNIDGTATGWIPFSSGSTVAVGTTPPVSPADNSLWFWNDGTQGGGQLFIRYNDGNSVQWVPVAPAPSSQAIPPGTVMDYAGGTLPTGWLFANGALVSRALYPALFAAIGITYGPGDGSSTFGLPDCGGRVVAGKEAVGTRLTTAVSGVDGGTVGATGGNQIMASHTHLAPSHVHTAPDHLHQGSGNSGNAVAVINGGTNFGFTTTSGNYIGFANVSGGSDRTLTTDAGNSSQNTGAAGTGASQNVQPTIIMNKIIKT